jgi:uncharacterized protein YdhG (YjbR/CyaY superfamily)
MKAAPRVPGSVDEYIAGFPLEVQKILQKIRATIRKAAPRAEEKISYGVPSFSLDGRGFAYFAGYKNHVSVYPAPRGVEQFKKALSAYKGGKGTVQFPLDEPIPFNLITRIVKFRMQESRAKTKTKAKAKAKAKAGTRAGARAR